MAKREELSYGMRQLEYAFKRVEEQFKPEDLPAPGGPKQWVMLRLAELGVGFRFDGQTLVDCDGTEEQFRQLNHMLNERYYAAAEEHAEAFRQYVEGESNATPWRDAEATTAVGTERVAAADGGAVEIQPADGALAEAGDGSGEKKPRFGSKWLTVNDIDSWVLMIPETLIEWFVKQDREYQEWLLNETTSEEREAEFQSVGRMLAGSNTATAAVAPAVGRASESEKPTTDKPPTAVEVDGKWVDVETGEVLDEVARDVGFVRKYDRITDNDGVCWFIELHNAITGRVENRFQMVEAATRRDLAALERFNEYYLPQVRQVVEPQLPRHKSDSKPTAKHPHKAGDLKAKNKKFEEAGGGVYFEKTGGLRIYNTAKLHDFVEQKLPPSKWAEYGVTREIKVDKRKFLAAYERDGLHLPDVVEQVPIHETGKIGIGVSGMWTLSGAKRRIEQNLSALTMRVNGDDNE